MNRKKKLNEILQKRLKKQNAKLHGRPKPRYISKAERAKMAAENAATEPTTLTETTVVDHDIIDNG